MEKLVNNMVEMLGSCDEKTNNLALNILKNNKELLLLVFNKLELAIEPYDDVLDSIIIYTKTITWSYQVGVGIIDVND